MTNAFLTPDDRLFPSPQESPYAPVVAVPAPVLLPPSSAPTSASGHAFELTFFWKTNGPLTKRISLDTGGKLRADGSACVMSVGMAVRKRFDSHEGFAAFIGKLDSSAAVALGALRPDLPDAAMIETKAAARNRGGAAGPGFVTRTADNILYQPGQPALVLIDIDTKGMPPEVRDRIDEQGGYERALMSVLPALATACRVVRASTSAGLRHADTNQPIPGSNGQHLYLLATDGTDAKRFLEALHDRCWLAGFGWYSIGKAGQFLERSLVDKMVWAPERLVFEGAPVLEAPLLQDAAAREPVAIPGEMLDTKRACASVAGFERAKLDVTKQQAKHRLKPTSHRQQQEFTDARVAALIAQRGLSETAARRVTERQIAGLLMPDLDLPWDDETLAGCTVADVLKDPSRFVGATLADPLEGPDYGRCKAKVIQRPDGSLWIHSFAHGRTIYDLRYDEGMIRAAIMASADGDGLDVFLKMVVVAALEIDQREALIELVAMRSAVGKRDIKARLKCIEADHQAARHHEEQAKRAAERSDPRPQLPVPTPDAPFMPVMNDLNAVFSGVDSPSPPMRNRDGRLVEVRVRPVPSTHKLTSLTASGEAGVEDMQSASDGQPLLTCLDEPQVAELIECYVDYTNEKGRSVHLPKEFVRHYSIRSDNILPIVTAVATLPIVIAGGQLLVHEGLDRASGIYFAVPSHVLASMPSRDECTPDAAADALRFLLEVWLGDVATDFTGKIVLIAAALTLIQRSILPERPAFFVTAGRRGAGKTITVIMITIAICGTELSASAWSFNEEERRKALMAHLATGVAGIVWDNIPRAATLSCPHIEKALTAMEVSDRNLGTMETLRTAANAVHLFTGNNIRPKGDLASRSLSVRLEVDRADPENRPFKHTDPIAWTKQNRSHILRALYVILLANPQIRGESAETPKTRFKRWWEFVGAALEAATLAYEQATLTRPEFASRPPLHAYQPVCFQQLFLAQEVDEEESSTLADALEALEEQWPRGARFEAKDVVELLTAPLPMGRHTGENQERITTIREFLCAKMSPSQTLTPRLIGRRLGQHVDDPVLAADGRTLVLKGEFDRHSKTNKFFVQSS